MIEAEQLAAEQAVERAAKEQRAVRLSDLVQGFEMSMRDLTSQLTSGATELETTAHAMPATAAQID